MEKKWCSGKISVVMSFVFFFVILGILWFVPPVMYNAFGNMYVIYVEILLALVAVLGCFLTGSKPSRMFPVKAPRIRDIFGVLMVFAGMYILSMTSVFLSATFMPYRFFEVGNSLVGIDNTLKFFAVAVFAPICEEAVHRGLVTHLLKPVRSCFVVILIVGLQFGVLHLEPVKFLSTAIAGGALAYVLLKTNNIVLCVLLHLLNNLPAALTDTENVAPMDINLIFEGFGIGLDMRILSASFGIVAGVGVLICAITPWIFYGASKLFGDNESNSENLVVMLSNNKRKITACVVISVICAFAGVIMVALCGMNLISIMSY